MLWENSMVFDMAAVIKQRWLPVGAKSNVEAAELWVLNLWIRTFIVMGAYNFVFADNLYYSCPSICHQICKCRVMQVRSLRSFSPPPEVRASLLSNWRAVWSRFLSGQWYCVCYSHLNVYFQTKHLNGCRSKDTNYVCNIYSSTSSFLRMRRSRNCPHSRTSELLMFHLLITCLLQFPTSWFIFNNMSYLRKNKLSTLYLIAYITVVSN